MIVNLYVDHMMSQSPTSSDDILAQTRDHSKLFSKAAARIGLTPAEYREFQASLLDGNAMYVRLPRRLDAMSANHRGSVYAVKNAVVTQPGMSWRVALADGNVVYVPQICGNISLLRHAAVASAPHGPKVVAAGHHKAAFVPALGRVAPTAVAVAPPAEVVPAAVAVPADAAVAAAPLGGGAAPAGAHGIPGFLFAIPAVIGGIIAGTTHHDSPTAPPCNQGSNLLNACQK